MNLQNIIDALNLNVLTESQDFTNITPNGAYASDMLSCVLAGAKGQDLWITLQSHANVIAVAAMLDLSAIILSENVQPDTEVLTRANQQGVTLLSTPLATYEVSGKLWELGLRTP